MAAGDLPALIESVFGSLSCGRPGRGEKAPEAPTPAVPIKKSIGTDFLVCLEDGKKLKMLKRHLASRYNLTPDEYRQRWGLPADYPMVAPAYAEQRSSWPSRSGSAASRRPQRAGSARAGAGCCTAAAVRVGGRRKSA